MSPRATFKRMEDSSREDWNRILPEVVRFARGLPDRVLAHLQLLEGDFGGFPIDRYGHCLQTATLALRDGREAALARQSLPQLGESMRFDHRRILATAIARLRAKLKYRPVVFELMPPEFTLTALQRTVEAISGRHLHKQNFRRLVENAALVEPTGETSTATGGRPAALFRFRGEVIQERPAPGVRLGGRF